MALKIINSKWTILIVRDLLGGDKYFGELKRSLRGISKKVLTEQLKSLEAKNIISKNIEKTEKIIKVRYALTELGLSLKIIIEPIAKWWFEHGQFIK